LSVAFTFDLLNCLYLVSNGSYYRSSDFRVKEKKNYGLSVTTEDLHSIILTLWRYCDITNSSCLTTGAITQSLE